MKNLNTYTRHLLESSAFFNGDEMEILDANGKFLAHIAGTSLEAIEAYELNLENADLVYEDLSGSVMSECNFNRALLTGSKMTHFDGTYSTFVGADLRKTNLNWASMENADLTDADLTDAEVYALDLRRAILKNVKGLETCKRITAIDLRGSDLEGVSHEFFIKIMQSSDSLLRSTKTGPLKIGIREYFEGCKGIPDVSSIENVAGRMKRSGKIFGRS